MKFSVNLLLVVNSLRSIQDEKSRREPGWPVTVRSASNMSRTVNRRGARARTLERSRLSSLPRGVRVEKGVERNKVSWLTRFKVLFCAVQSIASMHLAKSSDDCGRCSHRTNSEIFKPCIKVSTTWYIFGRNNTGV